jgi:hypothetical protein
MHLMIGTHANCADILTQILFGTRRAKPTKYRKNRDKAEMNVSDMYERQRSRLFELDHIFQEQTVNEGISRADPF